MTLDALPYLARQLSWVRCRGKHRDCSLDVGSVGLQWLGYSKTQGRHSGLSWFGLSRPYIQQFGVLRVQEHPSRGVTTEENGELVEDRSVLSYGSLAVRFLPGE